MPLPSLTQRLTDLTESNKQTVLLIQRLAKFSSHNEHQQSLDSSTGSLGSEASSGDEARADLSAEIHENLKQQEEDLETLKQDIEDYYPSSLDSSAYTQRRRSARSRRASSRSSELERESTRLSAGCIRLEEDLKLSRIRFRKALLQAQRDASAAKARERELYLDSLRTSAHSPPASTTDASKPASSTDLFAGRRGARKANPTGNQDDVVLSATTDITSSLRRTHNLLTSSLSQSRFAHDTLASSNAALTELHDRYSGLDDLLSKSRGLLGSLLRSQKSDTWYLETAFYLLAGTLAWLVFRRLLYGPLWWFLWLPIKLLYRVSSALWATVLAGSAATTAVSLSSSLPTAPSGPYTPSSLHFAEVPPTAPAASAAASSLSSEIGKMADAAAAARAGEAAKEKENDKEGAKLAGRPEDEDVQREDLKEEEEEEEEEPVRRADGTVLPKRDEATQPRNPMKRVLEEPRQEL